MHTGVSLQMESRWAGDTVLGSRKLGYVSGAPTTRAGWGGRNKQIAKCQHLYKRTIQFTYIFMYSI